MFPGSAKAEEMQQDRPHKKQEAELKKLLEGKRINSSKRRPRQVQQTRPHKK